MMLLDLVICTTPRGKSTEENVQFTSKVFELINNVKRLNRELYKLDHLFYLRQGTSLLAAAPLLHGKFRILMFLLCSHILAHNSHACFTYTSDDALRFLTRSIVRRTGAEEEVEGYHTSKILDIPRSWA
jgi:hypothetical protein